jgi:transcriptional regulator with XRE-family HTH domain
MGKRSQKIRLTNEARVLRALRLEHKLSLKRVGSLLGASASTIAHIETGRMNPPKDEMLLRLLKIYGGIKEKSYRERVRIFERKLTAREELIELVNRATDKQAQILLQMTKALLG